MIKILEFISDRRGNLPLMMAIMLLPMAICAGGALDLVAHERTRVQLQDSLDRGVLAATALDQAQDAQLLVESYLKSVPDITKATVKVDDNKTPALRKVTATVTMPYQTVFLRLVGIDRMTVRAAAKAQEARQNIELSLVLDISGSMLDNGGMAQLIPAAKSFLDVILPNDAAKKVTSVSIIPFAGGVNIGSGVFDYLAGSGYVRRHTKSSCFEMLSSDFAAAGTPSWPSRDQFPHFTYYNYNVAGKQPWWCPTDDVAVTYLSNDLTALKAKIDALKPYDGTGTSYGMKWAELLLNPSSQGLIKAISDNGLASIPGDFIGRPAAFDDTGTLKFIVLMTDGQIGFQPRPKSTTTNEVTTKNISASADNRTLFTQTQASDFYGQVCTYTKREKIVIFTIAFKVSASVAANIATCASDPSYAYKVDGLDMASAFQSIATTIKKIRLTE
jgi:Flp pilus assembly protein TadG